MPERRLSLQTQFIKVKTYSGATYFVPCEPRDLAMYVKCWMGAALHVNYETLRLYMGMRQIEDNASLHDQQIKNSSMLFLVKKNGDDWENLNHFMGIETTSATGRFYDSPARS